MKKDIIKLFALALIIITSGCKKDSPAEEDIKKEDKTVLIMRQKILGRWDLIRFIEETKEGSEPPEVIENDPQEIFFEFFANGKVKTNAEGEEELSYSVATKDTLILNGRPQKLAELTDRWFTFGNSTAEGGTSYKQTYILAR
ncbi:MAG: hypothetical protein K0R59_111 [Sphingobacterium sp.]|nr:hypothetical protein [Sphingobacterium sp.]